MTTDDRSPLDAPDAAPPLLEGAPQPGPEHEAGPAAAASAGRTRRAARAATRVESDSLGSREVPADAYWGIHTARALENFPISMRPISVYPDLVVALALVKQAAARANVEIGVLDPRKAEAIERACVEIRGGALHDQFAVGVIQGGAGTSTNMNSNEVIANRALEQRRSRVGSVEGGQVVSRHGRRASVVVRPAAS